MKEIVSTMTEGFNSGTARMDTAGTASPAQTPEKRLMVLDALEKLTAHFSKRRSFEEVVKVFLWTLSGQMSAPDTFAVIRPCSNEDMGMQYFATGRFDSQQTLRNIDWLSKDCGYFISKPGVHFVDDIEKADGVEVLTFELKAANVILVCPLLQDDEIVGMIGLGKRIGDKGYSSQDVETILTLSQTLTPFILNALLFEEVSNLCSWHQEVINSVNHGVLVFNSDFRFKSGNRAALNILDDLNPYCSQLASLRNAPLNVVFPDKVFSGWADRLFKKCRESDYGALNNLIIRHGESERVFNLKVVRTRGASIRGQDYIVTIEDVSDQTFAERRMIDLHRLADKGLMASSIPHELNNFLGMMIGGVQLAAQAYEKNDTDKLGANLARLEEVVLRMKRYTAGLTNFGKIETSRQLSSINDIVREVLSFARVQKRFSRINVIHKLDPSIPPIELDSDQIAQLLLNFTNNSADAIREAKRNDGEIVVSTLRTDDEIILSVSDNGVGMKSEVQEKLFVDRFTTKEDGHGFGLYICSEIAAGHNAKIRVSSEDSLGTIIEVAFPLS